MQFTHWISNRCAFIPTNGDYHDQHRLYLAGGTRTTVHGHAGDSIMRAALAAGVDGFLAECGGSMMRATCRCYVDENWFDKAGAREAGEAEMLESATGEVRKLFAPLLPDHDHANTRWHC